MKSETAKYRLKVSGYSGDAGDALAAPVHPERNANGMKFSTPDQDNDKHPRGACSKGKTAWWYKWCSRSDLNADGDVIWNADTDESTKDVKFTRMLVKLE